MWPALSGAAGGAGMRVCVCVCGVGATGRQLRCEGGGRGSDCDILNKERLHLFWVKHKERLHVSSYS